jgi:hypothetical protein
MGGIEQQRRSVAVRLVFPMIVVAGSATLAIRCSSRHESGGVETTKSGLVTTENSTAWWKVACPGCSSIGLSLAAALAPSPRGTEIFAGVGSPGSSGVEVTQTRSLIERKLGNTLFAPLPADRASIAVASADNGTTMDIFWVLANRTVTTMAWNGTTTSSPPALPYGQLLAGVGAAGKANRVDIFGVATDHNIWQMWRGTSWSGWSNLGSPNGLPTGNLASLQPGVLWLPTSSTNMTTWLEVFVVKNDGSVWMRRNKNDPLNPNWESWVSLGGVVTSGIAVTFAAIPTTGAFRVDVFAVDTNGDIQRRTSFDGGSTWPGNWIWIGKPPTLIKTTTIDGQTRAVAPAAVARAEGAIDLFVRDTNGDVQLMTIRPVASKSSGSERAMGTAPPACANVTLQENTAAATNCDGGAYDFLLSGAWSAVRVSESCLLDGGSSPPQCPLPSSALMANCAPYPMTFPPPGVPIFTGGEGSDNQIARLSDGSVIALSHQGICSQATCVSGGPAPVPCLCNGSAKSPTSGDLIFRTAAAECGTTWHYQGVIDMCNQIDPTGTNNCYSFTDPSDGLNKNAGGDRPEMAVRHTGPGTDDIFVTELLLRSGAWGTADRVLFKSSDQGTTWTKWFAHPTTAIAAETPLEITTVGGHVILYGRLYSNNNQPVIWSEPATLQMGTIPDPIPNPLQGFMDLHVLQTGDAPSIIHATLSVAQAGSSTDGDYVRIIYPVLTSGGKQATKTGLVRINSNETVTPLSDSFTVIYAGQSVGVNESLATGSVLFPTLIEADRVTGPSNGDERPPVVLFWVETTATPNPPTGCIHSYCNNWGTVSIKATVFRGASQSPTYVIDTADSQAWKGNGDYVHGASRYTGGGNPVDRFFVHWYNENSSGARMPMARLIDVVR